MLYYYMDRGFTTGSTHYAGGDLNFDNIVDGRDFFIMDMLYFDQLAAAPSAPAASVPEPASLLLGALPGLLLLRRRR